ncbi:hypothetical protein L465_00421 [Enterobacter sp. BIDMC 29]|uniref:hypothetical protein n=1 Tax=Enterobacter sp. BIDMC 29 TaxID=1329841 RepID=UPI00044B4FCB|nr:hypothetical protein [Enterobacter sp. BIDMC 29]EUM16607.1 hypothetical protein L465_00421 [Enterobacter sp. BIDMC 29]
MKFYIMSLLPVLLFTAGCSHSVSHWEKNAGQQSQLERDKNDCEYQSRLATASADVKASLSIGTSIGEGINIAEKQIDLVNDCMRIKGYHPG